MCKWRDGNMSIEKSWKLLNEMSFERQGGTQQELEACLLIQDYLKDLGLESQIEEFEVEMNTVEKAELRVLKPYMKTYECTGYKGCISTPDEGIVKKFCYFEQDHPVMLKRAQDAIVMVNGYVGLKGFKTLVKGNPAGFISFSGNIDESREQTDLDVREFRTQLHEVKELPGVHVKVHDAMEMVELGAEEVQLTVKGTKQTGVSRNLVCEIAGKSDEIVVCTAHYDSVPFSKGAYDNATGSVCLYEMAEYFAKHKPERTIRLVWCGSEERGLLGSKAYVKAHEDELDKTVLCVNIDMIGSTMGKRIAVCTSEMDFVHYIDYDAKLKGFPIAVSQGVYSSDSTPFADKNVPAVSFARITAQGTGVIHNRHDVMEHLSKRMLKEDMDYIVKFTEQLANGVICPVKKEMPENMRKELNDYLGISEKK